MIQIYGFNSKTPVKGALIRVGKRGQVFFLSDRGTLYTTRMNEGVLVYEPRDLVSHLEPASLVALKRLGVISAADITAAKKAAKARELQNRKDVHLRNLRAAVKFFGIPMPKVKGVRR